MSRSRALSEGFAFHGADVRWIVNPDGMRFLVERAVPRGFIESVDDPFGVGMGPVFSTLSVIKPLFSIVDSYDASPDFLEKLRTLSPLVLVDDCKVRPVERECDAVLNYNFNADQLGYERQFAHLMLGPEYALLRREFWDLKAEDGDTVLIIPGASDLLNTSERFVKWWQEGEGWPKAELVLGPLVDPSLAVSLTDGALELPNLAIIQNPPDLAARMARSRAVLCTSSVTSYEALALRKPLMVFQTAENQTPLGREIESLGLGVNLGWWGEWGAGELKQVLDGPPPTPPASVNPQGALRAASELLEMLKV